MFRKGQEVTVDAPGLAQHGSTGRVCCVRTDGDFEVEGLDVGFFDALFGPPIFTASQLKPAAG